MNAIQSIKIDVEEHRQRCAKLRQHLEEEGLSGVVLFDNAYILYYSGFAFIPTERPVAMVMNESGEIALVVPRLELEHARSNAAVQKVEHYIEYPDMQLPAQVIKNVMLEMSIEASYAADQDGYPWILGYQGPGLSELVGERPRRITRFIESQMMVKSEAELALIRESVKWGNLAHTLLQRYTRPGVTETEVSLRASMQATLSMLDAIGPIYRAQSPFSDGASAGYRGQIGRNAAIPHALANNIVFQAGDVLVTGASAPVWGYNSELERTMLIGEASDQQRVLFDHMLALQETAFNAIRPGVRCSQVDLQVRAYYEEHQLSQYWKHHSGHAIGLRYHEGPFLDVGDETLIQPAMVFTVEPGLYVPDIGGFRHSDTVAVTQDGIEIMTYYPRDLDSLTIPL
jgi:Xaa-Pro dipeptidase